MLNPKAFLFLTVLNLTAFSFPSDATEQLAGKINNALRTASRDKQPEAEQLDAIVALLEKDEEFVRLDADNQKEFLGQFLKGVALRLMSSYSYTSQVEPDEVDKLRIESLSERSQTWSLSTFANRNDVAKKIKRALFRFNWLKLVATVKKPFSQMDALFDQLERLKVMAEREWYVLYWNSSFYSTDGSKDFLAMISYAKSLGETLEDFSPTEEDLRKLEELVAKAASHPI